MAEPYEHEETLKRLRNALVARNLEVYRKLRQLASGSVMYLRVVGDIDVFRLSLLVGSYFPHSVVTSHGMELPPKTYNFMIALRP